MSKCTLRKAAAIGFSAVALLTFTISAQASSLVTNGSFASITNGTGGIGEFDNSTYTTVTDWASTGYNFIFASGTADTILASNGVSGNVRLWGPGDGSANGLPASSPFGGNYIAADGAYEVSAITQTISGLTVGDQYNVDFWWAGAQQYTFTGPTTEQWVVSLGSQSHSTVVLDDVSEGFTGWQYVQFTYTAATISEVLSFLSVGTPSGEPPFALLAGVSLNVVPEPGTLILMLGGMGLLGGLGVLRSKKCCKS